jgi:hypothetical protein
MENIKVEKVKTEWYILIGIYEEMAKRTTKNVIELFSL